MCPLFVIRWRDQSRSSRTVDRVAAIGVAAETRMSNRLLPDLVLFVVGAAPAAAENWPQWRGPRLNGLSAETDLPLRWSKTENIAWKLGISEHTAKFHVASILGKLNAGTRAEAVAVGVKRGLIFL